MLSCVDVGTLYTGMRGAFGEPQGAVTRVNIRQITFSVRTKESNKNIVIEGLHCAKYKFPGRRKIKSEKWGFKKLDHDEYSIERQAGRLFLANHGPPYEYFKKTFA